MRTEPDTWETQDQEAARFAGEAWAESIADSDTDQGDGLGRFVSPMHMSLSDEYDMMSATLTAQDMREYDAWLSSTYGKGI